MNDLEAGVRSAAGIAARQWPGVIEADDAEQEIWAHLLANDHTDLLSEMDEADRRSALRKIGSQIASQYRDDYEVFSGQVFYGTDDVRRLLAARLLDRNRDALDVTSETMTSWLDLHEGCRSLRRHNPVAAELIAARYLFGRELPGTDRMRLTRAVDALTTHMNRAHTRRQAERPDGPGSRRAVSNARAREIPNTQESA